MGFSAWMWLSVVILHVVEAQHPDCDHNKVIMNFKRMCHNYPYIKRSTINNDFGPGMTNEVGPWPPPPQHYNYPQQGPPPPPNYYGGGQGQPSWNYWNSPSSPSFPRRNNEEAMEDFVNPIYYEGDEVQATLERWRRDEKLKMELERFIQYKCCVKGCAFPSSYVEVERRTNICNLR